MKQLDKKVKKLWLLRNAFAVIPMVCLLIVVVIAVEGEFKIAVAISLGLLVLIISALLIVWPFLSYRFYAYDYDDLKITIKRGIIFRHEIVIPIRQIQDLHLYHGPLMQLFKLSGLIISTAGSNFTLSGISKEEALEMLKYLETRLESRLDSDEEVH